MSTELRQQLALLYAHARASGHDVTPEQIKLWFDEAMEAYAYKPPEQPEKDNRPSWSFELKD